MARVCCDRNRFYYLNKNSTSRNELTYLSGATLYNRTRTRRLLLRSPTTMLTTCDTVCPRCRHVFPVQTTLPSPTAPSIPLAVLSAARPMSNFPNISSLIAGVPSTTVQSTEFQQVPVHNNVPQLCCPLISHPVTTSTLSLVPAHGYTSDGCHTAPSTFHAVYPTQLSSRPELTSLPLGYQELRPSMYCYSTIPSPTYGLDVHQFSLHSLHSGSAVPQLPPGTSPGPKLNLSPPPARYTKTTRTMRQLSGGCLVDRSKNDETISIHEPRVTRQLSGGGLVDSTVDNFIRADEPQVSPSLPLMSLPPLRSSLMDECEYLTSDDSDAYGGLSFESRSESDGSTVTDRETISRTLAALRMSGWFYEGVGWHDSETMLRSSPDGTFIVRESSNPSYLFALTVRTPRNPTSIRVQYIDGKFRLDCVSNLTREMPQFECVVALIEHYVTHGARKLATLNDSNSCDDSACRRKVLVDSEGTIYSPVYLRRPLLKKDAVPSLMHLTRLAVNKAVGSNVTKRELPQKLERLELPICLKRYLLEYPYTI